MLSLYATDDGSQSTRREHREGERRRAVQAALDVLTGNSVDGITSGVATAAGASDETATAAGQMARMVGGMADGHQKAVQQGQTHSASTSGPNYGEHPRWKVAGLPMTRCLPVGVRRAAGRWQTTTMPGSDDFDIVTVLADTASPALAPIFGSGEVQSVHPVWEEPVALPDARQSRPTQLDVHLIGNGEEHTATSGKPECGNTTRTC